MPISVAASIEFKTIDGWGKQIYPSYIIASASIRDVTFDDDEDDDEGLEYEDDETQTVADEESDDFDDEVSVYELIGDPRGILGIELVAPKDNCVVSLIISADDWLLPSTCIVTLPEAGTTYRVMPKLRYRYSELARTHQTIPSSVNFRVKVDGEELDEQTETVVLHSINDCPFAVVEDGQQYEIGYVFAAYVNEQHPFVDKILREALDTGIVDSFDGYQSGDQAQTLLQVYAIWHALAERDLRYSNITAVAGVSDVVASQHVRLIDESINNAQANCVDGAVLMASLLRKIDIEPWLVMVPGHCYLAFSLDANGETIVGLETTLLGGSLEDYESIDALDELLDEETLEYSSYASFCSAINIATNDLAENADSFEDDEAVEYQLISISDARAEGILPIAFQSGNKFRAAQ